MAQDTSTAASSPLKLIVYWAIVAIPLSWGVYKTVVKSQPLFTGTSATASAMPTTPAAATPAPLATAPSASSASPSTADLTRDVTPPAPEATPFSTAQPAATVGPVDTPLPPKL